MGASIDLDFSSANRELDEIVKLSASLDFDLFEFLRLLSEEGLPTFTCEVDDVATRATRRRVARYELCQKLKMLLSTLRARNRDADEIKGGSDHLVTTNSIA